DTRSGRRTRAVARTRGRAVIGLRAGGPLGAAGLRRGPGRILRPIWKEENGVGGGRQDTPEQGQVGGGVEATVLPLRKDVPRAGSAEAEDVIALALTPRRDLGVLAAPRPRVRERAPLRARRFSAKQPQGLALWGTAQYLWPGRGAPRLPFGFIQMRGAQGRSLQAKAPVRPHLGHGENVVEDAAGVVAPLLEHGR